MNHLKTYFGMVIGGVATIAKACDVSNRAVYKWIERGVLPRTDYTKETNYAETIAKLPMQQGKDFSASDLLFPEQSNHQKKAA